MQLIWPGALALLALAPALLGLYLWMLRRRRRYAVRFSSLSLVREALSPYAQWRRHLPFALFLLALVGLVLALARPVAVVAVPSNQTSIILAMDVSRSMCSTDIAPNRLVAAQEAARSFVVGQPPGTRIAVVAFAGFAQLIQQPTTDRMALERAIGALTPGRGTAIGSGIMEALAAIAGINPAIAPVGQPAGVAPGDYAPEIIVLLTDGVTTIGTPPLEAAREAALRGVRVYTIGFGTENGSQSGLDCGNGQPAWGGGGAPQFGGFGGRFRRGIDEATLEEIAELTGGGYYAASSADELQDVFRSLPLSFAARPEATEITAVFAAAGTLLAALAIALSLLWSPR